MGFIAWEAAGQKRVLVFDAVLNERHKWESEITEHPVENGANIADHVRPMLDEVTLDVFISNSPVEPRLYNFLGATEVVPHTASMQAKTLENYAGAGGVLGVSDGGFRSQSLTVPQPPRQIPLTPGGAVLAGASALVDAIKGPPQYTATAGLIRTTKARSITALVQQFDQQGLDVVAAVAEQFRIIRSTPILVNVFTTRMAYQGFALKSVEMTRDSNTGDGAKFTLMFKQVRTVKTKTGDVRLPSAPKDKQTKDVGAKTPQVIPADPTKVQSFAKTLKEEGGKLFSIASSALNQ